jgi:hypothetical protein
MYSSFDTRDLSRCHSHASEAGFVFPPASLASLSHTLQQKHGKCDASKVKPQDMVLSHLIVPTTTWSCGFSITFTYASSIVRENVR